MQDNLAMNAIRFLTTVASGVHHELFRNEGALKQVCEKIVIPNLTIREDDEEMFDLNWVEYVRRDTEGSDSDTRRRAAAELVKSLTAKFPNEASNLICPSLCWCHHDANPFNWQRPVNSCCRFCSQVLRFSGGKVQVAFVGAHTQFPLFRSTSLTVVLRAEHGFDTGNTTLHRIYWEHAPAVCTEP